MQKLKSLNLSHLSESAVNRLAKNRIVTILDFLQEDVLKLSTLTKLSLSEIITIRNYIFTKYSAPLINGNDLLTKVLETRSVIKTGIESLDAILNGGIPATHITEICGLAGSGKTQLSLQLAINCVQNADSTVLYIDTKGDFSAIKVQKILDAHQCSHKDMAVIMYKIRVVHIWSMEDLVELFKRLKNKMLVIEHLALIIVDSLPCLMFQYIGDESKIGLYLLNNLVNYSRYIGNEFNVGIIYINIQTRWIDNDISDMEDEEVPSALKEPTYIEKRNRCLGRYWQNIPSLVLLIERLEDNSLENRKDGAQIKVLVASSINMKNVNSQCILNLSAFGIT